jgi:hypothetical protein
MSSGSPDGLVQAHGCDARQASLQLSEYFVPCYGFNNVSESSVVAFVCYSHVRLNFSRAAAALPGTCALLWICTTSESFRSCLRLVHHCSPLPICSGLRPAPLIWRRLGATASGEEWHEIHANIPTPRYTHPGQWRQSNAVRNPQLRWVQ